MILGLARHNPIVLHISQKRQQFCLRFLFLSGNGSSLWGSFVGCSSTLWCGSRHLSLALQPLLFIRIDTRENAHTHKVISYKYLHGCDESCQGYFLLLTLLFLDTLRPRDIGGSEGVAAFGVGFCARSLLSCQKLHWSPFGRWSFPFHW